MSSTVAMIGSYRKHLPEMAAAADVFTEAGITVTNPLGFEAIKPGVQFVRFAVDDPALSDAEIQENAIERILAADAVYVMCPQGYMGLTACYEYGRIMGYERPVYFYDEPEEPLPNHDSAGRIVSAERLAELVLSHKLEPLVTPLSQMAKTELTQGQEQL